MSPFDLHDSRTFINFHDQIRTQGAKRGRVIVIDCCFVVALPPETPPARRR